MSPDHIEELALIEMSRLQRETLDRWVAVCINAGEIEQAEAIRIATQAEADRQAENMEIAA